MSFPVNWWEYAEEQVNPYSLPPYKKAITPHPRESRSSYAESTGTSQCKKGKSCKATCIYRGDDCIEGLDPKLASDIRLVIGEVEKFVSRGGDEGEALQVLERLEGGKFEANAKAVAKAINAMEKIYPNPGEREEKINQVFDLVLPGIAKKNDPGEIQAYTAEDIDFLAKNKNIDKYEAVYKDIQSGKLKSPEEINEALRPLAASRRVNEISEAQIDLAMALLPPDLKNSLKTQGNPGEWGKWGKGQSSLEPPEGGWTPTNKSGDARARLILRIGMEEGMRDMYTGRKVGFGDIDLEHTIPFKVAGQGAETGANFGLTTRLSNRSKADGSPESWRQSVLSLYERKDGKLTEAGLAKLQREQIEAAEYNAKRESIKNVNAGTVAAVFKGIEDSNEKPENKAKLKNKALNAIAGYTETYFQGWRANRSGQPRRLYVYRDDALGVKIMDLAAQKIDAFQKSGDAAKVEKVLELLRSGPVRINEKLTAEFGPKRTDAETKQGGAAMVETIKNQILQEIQGL